MVPKIKIIKEARAVIHWGKSSESVIDDLNNISILHGSYETGEYDLRKDQADSFYIVTPSYNSNKFIDSTILSVISQEGNFELRYHVQDGGSTDGTIEKLVMWKKVLADHENLLVGCRKLVFSFESCPDRGMYDAISKGFSKLNIPDNGICAWINSDDTLTNGALASVLKVINNNKDALWVIGAVNGCGEKGEDISRIPIQYPTEIIREGLCDGHDWNFIQQEGSFWVKKLWDKVNGLNTSLKLCGDWDLWRRFAHYTDPIHLFWPTGRFRKHKSQLTSTCIKDYYLEMESIIPKEIRIYRMQKMMDSVFDKIKGIYKINPNLDLHYDIAPLLDKFTYPNTNNIYVLVQKLLKNIQDAPEKQFNSSLKVLTFCTIAKGGAGTGSQRRILALRDIGVNAKLLSIVSYQPEKHIGRVEPTLDAIDTSDQLEVWKIIHQNNSLKERNLPGFCAQEFFTSTESVIDMHQLKSAIDDADIVHLHWVVGMLDYENMGTVLEDKPVAWTLADMNAFTGGCHYSEGCKEFMRECKDCPLLGGNSVLAHETWKIKKKAYAGLNNLNIICPSNWMAELAKKSSLLSDKPIHVIPNAYPIDRFVPVEKNVARKKLNLPIDKKLLLFGADSLSNLRKGGDLLQEAMRHFSEHYNTNDLAVITFGEGKLNLKIPVHSLGYLYSEETLSLAYSAADIYVFTSREDNAPLTVGESLLCGTLVVGFPVGNLPDLVEHKSTGYLAKYLDCVDLANGINWALETVEKDLNISNRCRQNALKYHDPVLSAKRHKALYEKMLKSYKKTEKVKSKVHNTIEKKSLRIAISNINEFTYAKRSHWSLFDGFDQVLFGCRPDMDEVDLKKYQDLLVFTFIKDHIPAGSRILDVGGGVSRILKHFAKTYECWNIDKLEGVGNGPKQLNNIPYRLVQDYMGNFNPELPDNYFDFVFSISALEHVPQNDPSLFDSIIDDINRVLKPGAYSLHLFDVVFKGNILRANKFIYRIFERVNTLNKFITPPVIYNDPDVFFLSELAYNNIWMKTTKKTYAEFGRPTSLNIFWAKENHQYKRIAIHSEKSIPLATIAGSNKIYIITPCFNVAQTIDQTIQSVISQSGDFFIRYHIQDGGSTDLTFERLQYWEALLAKPNPRVQCRGVTFTWSSEQDQGMYDGIIKGFDSMNIAPSEFMAWINGDDILLPDTLATITRIATEHPEIQWIGSHTHNIDQNGKTLTSRPNPTPTAIIREGLCDGHYYHWYHLQQEGTFFKKSLWFRAKHVLRGYSLAGDWALWRELARHAEYYQFDKPLGAFRKRDGQLSIARRDEYNAEIEATLPMKQRDEAFQRLYVKRDTLSANVIRIGNPGGKIIVEKEYKGVQEMFDKFWKKNGEGERA